VPLPPDPELTAALRRRDEAVFCALVDEYSPALLRVARTFVPSSAVAEEVVQDTWIAVIRGIDSFEGRSSLKTWIFRVLTNTAMTSGRKERRSTPLDGRFLPEDHEQWPGHWAIAPAEWPEDRVLNGEAREVMLRAIADLPSAQRTVIALRDVEGWSAEEVCEALEISPGNQRVLLHRARTTVRADVESYFGAVESLV
jgi:RNA polymerase sigma-70 factor (ECF subfamily)